MRTPKSHSKITSGTIEAWLISDDSNEQRLAEEALHGMTKDEQRDFYRRVLKGERLASAYSFAKFLKRFLLSLGVVFASDIVHLILSTSVGRMVSNSLLDDIAWQILVNFPIMGIMHFQMFRTFIFASELQKNVRERFFAIATLDDISSILSEVLHNPYTFKETSPALIRLLPRMNPESRHLLSSEQWDVLGQMITIPIITLPERKMLIPGDVELKRAILHGIGKAGEERMQPVLETVASTPAKTADEEQLRQLASNYLSILSKATVTEDERNLSDTVLETQTVTKPVESEPVRRQMIGRG